jgi:hypothetical protein
LTFLDSLSHSNWILQIIITVIISCLRNFNKRRRFAESGIRFIIFSLQEGHSITPKLLLKLRYDAHQKHELHNKKFSNKNNTHFSGKGKKRGNLVELSLGLPSIFED